MSKASHISSAKRREDFKRRVRAGEVLVCREGREIKGEKDENTGKPVYHQSARPYYTISPGKSMYRCPHCGTQIQVTAKKYNETTDTWEPLHA